MKIKKAWLKENYSGKYFLLCKGESEFSVKRFADLEEKSHIAVVKIEEIAHGN